jgi:hypothetical protein
VIARNDGWPWLITRDAATYILGVKNLFDHAAASEIQGRLDRLRPNAAAQWGRMTVAQAMAHCALAFDMAHGDLRPPRKLIGRLLGPIIKPLALGDDKPMRRNSPTVDHIEVTDSRGLDSEREKLRTAMKRFAKAGPAGCTTHPHPFFGRMTPDEWAVLMYKHVDHHLRQFGA